MLYVFAGFPSNGLHAGGLQFTIEEVEELAVLNHDLSAQYRKEGVFTVTSIGEEWLRPVEFLLSPAACYITGEVLNISGGLYM